MDISILYWGVWNYKPQAVSLADELKKGLIEANVETVEGSGGVFEVTLNGSLIFSKKDTDRFPNEGEVLKSIKETD